MPSGALQTIDALVIIAYLGVTFLAGIYAHRIWHSGTENDEEYYLAGRRVPAWVNGISYAATAINADVAPLYCGMAAVVGLPVAWFYLSRFGLAWMIVAMLFAVRWRQLGIRTGPEFYALRFGGRSARLIRVYSSAFTVGVNIVPWIGAGLLGTHMILAPILGVESKAATLACVVPLVAIYVWVSGYAGVLATDVFQSLMIVAAGAVLLVAVLVQAGGPGGIERAIVTAHPQEYPEILSVLPARGHEVLGPLLVLSWLVVPTIGRGGSVDVDGQRIFSCRSSREAAKMTIWGQIAMFTMLLLLTLPVMGLLARYPNLYHATRSQREQAYGQMLAEYLPNGLLGLAVAGVLASVMSTISGLLSYGSQTVVNDVLRPLLPGNKTLDPTRAGSVWAGRVVMLGILLGGIGVMFAADSLFRIAVVISGTFAASAAFFWAQWWWWRINVWSWVAAMVGGPLTYFSLGWLLPQWPWWAAQLARGDAVADALAMLQAILAMGLATGLWASVALLTNPESPETLTRFYVQAQPLGRWGQVRTWLEQETKLVRPNSRGLLLGGLATASLGAIWIALAVLGLSQVFVGRYGLAAALLGASFAVAVWFYFAFEWHMTRMGADD